MKFQRQSFSWLRYMKAKTRHMGGLGIIQALLDILYRVEAWTKKLGLVQDPAAALNVF